MTQEQWLPHDDLNKSAAFWVIKHPNIVQYLGTYKDPETYLQVLIMELLDGNLTQLLERSKDPLPYHT